ncbi:MAG: penicillin acylase family protein, partial [Pseudomonadota bacterium]|nr:penicillin acylase family protein [Pseudomonadota bacterium]
MKDTILLFIILVPFSQSVFASKDANQYDAPPYSATITRDIWGVPHIFGKRDSDAAFGLAYAHAQDDIKNIAENMHLYRAKMGLKIGFKGAVTDYLIKALEIEELIRANYYSKLSSEVRAVVEGYVAGLNYWNSVNKNNKYKALFPITERDVIAGFV